MGLSSLALTQLEFSSVPWSSFSTSMPFLPPAQTDHGNSGWCMTDCFLAPTFNTTVDNSFFSFTLCTFEKSQMRWPWVSPHSSIWANSRSQHCGRCRDNAHWHVLRAHRAEGAWTTWQLPLWARSALLHRTDIGKEPQKPQNHPPQFLCTNWLGINFKMSFFYTSEMHVCEPRSIILHHKENYTSSFNCRIKHLKSLQLSRPLKGGIFSHYFSVSGSR
jgi:hypothetical protein